MGWKKSICPNTVSSHGEIHEFDFCINHCEWPCLPRTIIYNMVRNDEQWEERKAHAAAKADKNARLRISVTSLQYCLRKNYYNTIYDYAEEPTNRWNLYRGTVSHAILEPFDKEIKDYLSEWKFVREFEDVDIVCVVDAIDFRLKRIEDHKTIKDTGQNMRIKKGASKEQEEQININRWVAAETHPEVMKFDMVINNVSMGQIVTSDTVAIVESWRKPPGKPPKEKGVLKIEDTGKTRGATGAEQKKWNIYYQVPKVKKWTEKRIIKHLKEKVPIMEKALRYDIVPPHIGKGGAWLCEMCCHADRCTEYEDAKEII